MAEGLDFKVNELWREFARENLWAAHIPEFAEKDGQKFMRSRGRQTIYRVVRKEGDNQEYVCNSRDSEILGATVAHPIHDGPFPLSGSGKCEYETVPYCPKCEQRPSFHGSPITVKFAFSM